MRHGRDRADLSSQVRVLVALAVQDPADPDVAIAVLRGGIEDVVLPATFVDLDWHTTAITPADDLERDTTGLRSPSRDLLPPEMTAKERDSSGTCGATGGGRCRRPYEMRPGYVV